MTVKLEMTGDFLVSLFLDIHIAKKEKNFRGYENAEYLLPIAFYVKCTHWEAQDALTEFLQKVLLYRLHSNNSPNLSQNVFINTSFILLCLVISAGCKQLNICYSGVCVLQVIIMLFWSSFSGLDIKLHFLLEEISSTFLIYTRISPKIRIYDIYYSSSTYGICYFIYRRKAAEFDTSCLWQICYLLLICLLSSSYLKIIILYVFFFFPWGVWI